MTPGCCGERSSSFTSHPLERSETAASAVALAIPRARYPNFIIFIVLGGISVVEVGAHDVVRPWRCGRERGLHVAVPVLRDVVCLRIHTGVRRPEMEVAR